MLASQLKKLVLRAERTCTALCSLLKDTAISTKQEAAAALAKVAERWSEFPVMELEGYAGILECLLTGTVNSKKAPCQTA